MSPEPPVLPGAEEARRWAAEELAKPEYREAAPSWLSTVWQDFLDWLGSLGGSAEPGAAVPSPIIGIVIALVIALAVILARPRLNAAARQSRDVFESDTGLDAADFRLRAEASATSGHWEEAVVDRFRALVRAAEERTVLDPQPGRTADEVARELALPFSPQAPRLQQAAAAFDAVRYGNYSADRSDYQEMVRLDEDLAAAKPAQLSSQQLADRP